MCHGVAASIAAALFLMCSSVAVAQPAVVDFDDPGALLFSSPYGQAFGSSPGQVVISQDGIDMSVEEFFLNTFVGFVRAEVDGPLGDSFPTQPLELDNISARFDFSGVGFAVNQVTLEYEKLGGNENFAVNDGSILQLNDLADLPANIAPGVSASVQNGLITLTGPITSFLIGGQELAIDNVTAVPEPCTLVLLGGAGAALLVRRSRRRI